MERALSNDIFISIDKTMQLFVSFDNFRIFRFNQQFLKTGQKISRYSSSFTTSSLILLCAAKLVFQTGDVHSEEWTLVGVHKMEKREPFQTWLTDMQANILNCARKIVSIIKSRPTTLNLY